MRVPIVTERNNLLIEREWLLLHDPEALTSGRVRQLDQRIDNYNDAINNWRMKKSVQVAV